jgi:hypothetical protein
MKNISIHFRWSENRRSIADIETNEVALCGFEIL